MARSPTYSETVLLDQPNAYWRLSSASTITDSAGHVSVGTATSCTSVSGLLQGDTDRALAFDGVSSIAVVPTSATLSPSTAYTFEAWVRPSVVGGTMSVLRKFPEYDLQTAGSSFQGVTWSGSTAVPFRFGPTLAAGTTYHVVWALDGYSMYGVVNGGTYGYGAAPAGWPTILPGSSGATIGYFFFGTIDEVAVYDYKISEPQAFAHYIAGNDATPTASTVVVEVAFSGNATEDYYQQVVDDGPIMYYRFNETSGTSFANYVQASVNGTVVPPLTAHGTFTLNQTSPIPNDTGDHAVAWGGTTFTYAEEGSFTDGSLYGSGQAYALESWLKTATVPSVQKFICGWAGGAQLAIEPSTGKLHATMLSNSTAFVSGTSITNVCDGSYHHVVYNYLGGSDGTVQLYVDGVLEYQAAGIGNPKPQNLSFIVAGTAALQNFGGTIDEVAFYYNNYLSADRVGLHYGTRNNQRPLVWTDISSYVRGYSVSQGRQHELDRYEAATLSLTVNNDDRRFEADYTGSPYYPNVLPYRRIRVWESKDGVRFPIFNGWIERWPQAWIDRSYHSEVQIQAVDGFDILNGAVIDATSLSSSSGLPTDYWIEFFLFHGANWDEDAYPVVRNYLAGVLANQSSQTSASVLSLVQAYEVTENGEFYIDRFGRPTFRARDSRSGAPVLATFGDAAGELPYRDIVPSLDRDNIINDVTVTRDGGTAQQVVDYDSIAGYGRRSLQVSTLNVSDSDALSTAQSILDSHATPARRFEQLNLLYADGGSNPLLVQLLSRGIGDRIKVRRRPTKSNPASVMEEEVLISHVQINRSPKLLEVSWQLIPAP